MKRRNFLKLIGLSVAAPSAVLAVGKPKKYMMGCDIAHGESQTVITLDEFSDKSWAAYHKNYNLSQKERQEMLRKFRAAFKNTKFKPNLKGKVYFNGVRIYYRSRLDA